MHTRKSKKGNLTVTDYKRIQSVWNKTPVFYLSIDPQKKFSTYLKNEQVEGTMNCTLTKFTILSFCIDMLLYLNFNAYSCENNYANTFCLQKYSISSTLFAEVEVVKIWSNVSLFGWSSNDLLWNSIVPVVIFDIVKV